MEYQIYQTTESSFIEKSENFQEDTTINDDSLKTSKFVCNESTYCIFINFVFDFLLRILK